MICKEPSLDAYVRLIIGNYSLSSLTLFLWLAGLMILSLKLSFAITSLHCQIAAQKTPFLQQACHRMILQIVETGFPAHSDT